MAGVAVQVQLRGFDSIQSKLRRMANIDIDSLMDAIGTEVEGQTKRRIESEKTGPDGKVWPPWSDEYAKTRHSGHSLLRSEGHLLESITHNVVAEGVDTGTNLGYGASNQDTRPYLGLSPQNEDDIDTVINDWLREEMAL